MTRHIVVWTVFPVDSHAKTVLFIIMHRAPSTIFRYASRVCHPNFYTEFFTQRWNGSFFVQTPLFSLGASYQLGHSVDDPCTLPSPPSTLILFDISGAHAVRITYCFCDLNNQCQYGKRRVQLLRAGWFPASWHRPGTAFTFRLLDFTHKLQTRSKINLFDFHAALGSISNSTTPAVRVGLSTHPLYT